MKIKQITVKEIDVPGLGERIKQARLSLPKSGKSLSKLCLEAGLSRTYWYDIENEKIDGALSIESLRKIERVLGVDFGVSINGGEDGDE